MTRWHLSIPDRTDRAVRTFLARSAGGKGGLSRFVDDAVRRHLFDLTLADIKARRNAGYGRQDILDLVDEPVDAARTRSHPR